MHVTQRQRLGEEVRRRRLALGLSATQAAEQVPVARQTWAAIEAGAQQVSPHRHAGIERVLRWAPGSIDLILDGHNPIEIASDVEAPQAREPEPTLEEEIDRLRRRPGLTQEQRRAALRALIDFYAEPDDDEGRTGASAG